MSAEHDEWEAVADYFQCASMEAIEELRALLRELKTRDDEDCG